MSDAKVPQSAADASSVPLSISSANIHPFLDISPDALVIVDRNGNIVLVNGQTEAVFGYARSELLGQPLELLLPQRFHTAHASHRERYFSAPRTRPMGIGLNLVGRRKDGTEFPVEISLNPLLLDGALHALGAVRDVSAQRAVERERHQQAQQIRLQADLLNLAHDAIFVRAPASRVTFWNTGAEELYGWAQQEALGRVSHVLLKTRFPVDLATIEAQLARDGQWQGELVQTRRDGGTVIVESRWAGVRDEQGHPTAIMEINRDITRRRELEQAEHAVYAETAARLTFMQQVLDALPSGIYLVYGREARLLLANRATASVWGAQWPTDQPMLEFLAANGIALFDAQGYPMPPEQYATLRAVGQGETVLQQQEAIRRPGGSSLPVLVSALPLPQPPGTDQLGPSGEAMALVIHQDVTALKEAEYLKDEFVGIVAHELRTPLAALQGFADTLAGRAPAAAARSDECGHARQARRGVPAADHYAAPGGGAHRACSAFSRYRPGARRAGTDQSHRQCHQVQPAGGPGDCHPLGRGGYRSGEDLRGGSRHRHPSFPTGADLRALHAGRQRPGVGDQRHGAGALHLPRTGGAARRAALV